MALLITEKKIWRADVHYSLPNPKKSSAGWESNLRWQQREVQVERPRVPLYGAEHKFVYDAGPVRSVVALIPYIMACTVKVMGSNNNTQEAEWRDMRTQLLSDQEDLALISTFMSAAARFVAVMSTETAPTSGKVIPELHKLIGTARAIERGERGVHAPRIMGILATALTEEFREHFESSLFKICSLLMPSVTAFVSVEQVCALPCSYRRAVAAKSQSADLAPCFSSTFHGGRNWKILTLRGLRKQKQVDHRHRSALSRLLTRVLRRLQIRRQRRRRT